MLEDSLVNYWRSIKERSQDLLRNGSVSTLIEKADRQMRIALVGDVMLGRLVNKMLKHSNPAYPWGNTLSILQTADLRICNLECVLSDIGYPWSIPHLRCFTFAQMKKISKHFKLPKSISFLSLTTMYLTMNIKPYSECWTFLTNKASCMRGLMQRFRLKN